MIKWVLFLNCVFILNPLVGQNKYNDDPSIIKDPTGYKLRIGDSLRIAVRGETETAVDAIIDSEGKVRVVYLGELKVSGMNSKQVEKLIVNEYQKNLIYQNPIVSILITKYSDRVVFLSGSVNRKGPYIFPPEVEAMNIVEVIARAGGFTDIARKNKVFVTRTFYDVSGQVKDTKTYEVNVEALSTGNLLLGSASRFWIYPGDRIEVPERLI
ncbi:MAG: hypothetical protein CMI23_06425 [Opitutae bacterium]|nr:hypothetical protein [Opitutae bacterium]|tara:strand:+ start:13161 stop:13796 length:636 start_codon:yes stop_codon:yes gene_type:complete